MKDMPRVTSPDGFEVVARAGPERKPLPPSHGEIRLVEPSWLRRSYRCGHRGPRKFKLDVYGSIVGPFKQQDECPGCVTQRYKKFVIRCVLCGLPICPGDSVALYSSQSLDIHPEHATCIGDAVIGCMGWNCCPAGGFFAGNWTEEGFVPYPFDGEQVAAKPME